jgi:hypothetical protein
MTPLNHSARRINALGSLYGARRYLEIGVDRGTTFAQAKRADAPGA